MSEYKQKLITDNMKLVYHIINKYYPTFTGNEDVIQEGMLGLCKAAETFNDEKSTFSTYASTCILNQIKMWFRINKKHNGHLSLDYVLKSEEGETLTTLETLFGDEDVDYVDYKSVFGNLSETEQAVCELLEQGYKGYEIAEKLGKSRIAISKIKNKIKCKVRKRYGNN